jgi:RNA polymerase sigma factor (sigma-70 family)
MKTDWNSFVRHDAPRLYRYFLARFGHHTACDLVQETLTRLVAKVEGGAFDPSRGPLMAYAFGLAHFVAREAWKSRGREDPASDDAPWERVADEADDPQESHSRRRAIANLRRALLTLPAVEQEVLSLLVDEELSLPEIALIMDLPLNTIKSHVHRAKARLRGELAPTMEGGCHE